MFCSTYLYNKAVKVTWENNIFNQLLNIFKLGEQSKINASSQQDLELYIKQLNELRNSAEESQIKLNQNFGVNMDTDQFKAIDDLLSRYQSNASNDEEFCRTYLYNKGLKVTWEDNLYHELLRIYQEGENSNDKKPYIKDLKKLKQTATESKFKLKKTYGVNMDEDLFRAIDDLLEEYQGRCGISQVEMERE